MGSAPSVPQTSIHEFTVKDSKGKDVDLRNYKGKVLLVVNVASKCGFTNSNYTQLTELYSKYKDKGFEILAFPCNQFLKQEPGTSEEAEQFACTRFKAEYPIFSKVRVNGPTAAPVYKFLKASKGGWFGSSIKWNFTKFLVDKEGRVIRRYGTSTQPSAIELDTYPSPSNTEEMYALEKFPSVALYGLPPSNEEKSGLLSFAGAGRYSKSIGGYLTALNSGPQQINGGSVSDE